MLVGMPFANGLRGPTTRIPVPRPQVQFVESFAVVGDRCGAVGACPSCALHGKHPVPARPINFSRVGPLTPPLRPHCSGGLRPS
jgi:hypothetical protein